MSNNIDKQYLDIKYSRLLSPSLEGSKVLSDNPLKLNFRCPLCGDSHNNKSKKRGYIYFNPDKHSYYFHCHNCNEHMAFSFFLQRIDSGLYHDYLLEGYKYKSEEHKQNIIKKNAKGEIKQTEVVLNGLIKVSKLMPNHKVKKYITQRLIPTNKHFDLWYTPHFEKYINTIFPNKFNDKYITPRLILPMRNRDGKVFGINARALNDSTPKYINILFDDNYPKVFGLHNINPNKPVYILEGAIDSLFVENAIALNGTSSDIDSIKELGGFIDNNFVFVFDNQPRHKDVIHVMQKHIMSNDKIVIFPDNIHGKDINQMIMDDNNIDIMSILRDNTFRGLSAKLRFAQWKKI